MPSTCNDIHSGKYSQFSAFDVDGAVSWPTLATRRITTALSSMTSFDVEPDPTIIIITSDAQRPSVVTLM